MDKAELRVELPKIFAAWRDKPQESGFESRHHESVKRIVNNFLLFIPSKGSDKNAPKVRWVRTNDKGVVDALEVVHYLPEDQIRLESRKTIALCDVAAAICYLFTITRPTVRKAGWHNYHLPHTILLSKTIGHACMQPAWPTSIEPDLYQLPYMACAMYNLKYKIWCYGATPAIPYPAKKKVNHHVAVVKVRRMHIDAALETIRVQHEDVNDLYLPWLSPHDVQRCADLLSEMLAKGGTLNEREWSRIVEPVDEAFNANDPSAETSESSETQHDESRTGQIIYRTALPSRLRRSYSPFKERSKALSLQFVKMVRSRDDRTFHGTLTEAENVALEALVKHLLYPRIFAHKGKAMIEKSGEQTVANYAQATFEQKKDIA